MKSSICKLAALLALVACSAVSAHATIIDLTGFSNTYHHGGGGNGGSGNNGGSTTTNPNLVSNGSFEADTSNAAVAYRSAISGGWTASSRGLIAPFQIDQASRYSNHIAAADGNQYLELNSLTTKQVSQTITTTTSPWYSLSFSFAANSVFFAANELAVYWGGTLIDTVSANPNGDWTTFTYASLTSSSASTVLSFRSVSGNLFTSAYLDNISVTAVPEPGVYAMLLLGLSVVLLGVRRNRDRAAVRA